MRNFDICFEIAKQHTMMTMQSAIVPLACLAALSMSPYAAAAGPAPGLYEVEARLELPNLADAAVSKTTTLCLTPADADARGLAVLSDNNPLAKCPASNISESSGVLMFDIACPGRNAASGSAIYRLAAESFEGRISMKMGGKNMTMFETQVGRRIGDCGSKRATEPK